MRQDRRGIPPGGATVHVRPAWATCMYRAVLLLGVLAAALGCAPATVRPVVGEAQGQAAELTEEEKVIHLLNRISYGPRPGDFSRVQRMGIQAYLQQQLHPERIEDAATETRLAGLDSLRMTTIEIAEKYPAPLLVARQAGLDLAEEANPMASPDAPPTGRRQQERRRQIAAYYAEHGLKLPQRLLQELQAQKLIRAVASERQLQEVMTDFWFNHFNVFWGKGADRWLTTDFELHAIRPHALGRMQELLLATARSPAMLFYLDNFLSSAPDAKRPERRGPRDPALGADPPRNRRPGINENYARELLELHTLGVDGGYTQQDVQEVARCFTGWTLERPRQGARFVFRAWMHDAGQKIVLGQTIPAGGGVEDGEKVIAILARHPSTARFLATKLARRFVSDHPPASLIQRVAAVYLESDGDVREMLRTLFTAPEFYARDAYRAKIKSPLELAASAIRALDGTTDGAVPLAQFIARMGQPLYQYLPPTGFPDRAEHWVSTGALLERLNFALALSAQRISGTGVDLTRATAGIDRTQAPLLLQRAITVLLHDDVSAQTRAALAQQVQADLPARGKVREDTSGVRPPLDPVVKVVGLVLGSPEFQRR